MIATLAFSVVMGAVVWVNLAIVRRFIRPAEPDLYCCGCSGRPCAFGCCHLSCVFHDPDAIELADYKAQWAEVVATMGDPWEGFELPCNCPTEEDDPGPYGHVILHDLSCPNAW